MIKNDKRTINAWAFYDWANSSYPLVITAAIFPVFYENATRTGTADTLTLFGLNFRNSELYSYTVSLSFLIVSFLSPFLSGIADYIGNKKRFMQFFCYLGAFSCASLFFFDVKHLGFSLLSVLFASVGFWSSLVFYNAYLPEIVDKELQDKTSAKGYALGYLGGSILLIMCLAMIMNYKTFGFEDVSLFGYTGKGLATRCSFLLVALWWIGFAQIAFSRLPSILRVDKPKVIIISKGFRELNKVWHELKNQQALKRYLTAFFVYSMGVQTVMLMAVLFAKKEIIGMQDTNLIVSILIIQFVGIAGAYLFSFLSRKLGNLKALGIAVLIWITVCIGIYFFVYVPNQFYLAAVTVGLIMGGIQSLSRSTYSKLLPPTEDTASYFSFYDVCEKLGIVIGTFSFGYIEGFTGSMRNSVLALISFFVLGFILLLRVPKNASLIK